MLTPSQLLDSWDAAEDSEVEREKAKTAAEKKAKADAEAAAEKKSKAQRIAERAAARQAAQLQAEGEDEDEDEAERRLRLRRTEQESDLKHAEDLFGVSDEPPAPKAKKAQPKQEEGGDDLFGTVGISNDRKATTAANAVQVDAADPTRTVDLHALPLFDPKTKLQFDKLRSTLVPLLGAHSAKPHYFFFLQDLTKELAKDLPSGQIKTIASGLTAAGNDKMKQEKAAEKGGKKSKAAKTKTTLAVGRNAAADTSVYDDDFGE